MAGGYLEEITIPCLVCGRDVLTAAVNNPEEVVVKEEVLSSEETGDNAAAEGDHYLIEGEVPSKMGGVEKDTKVLYWWFLRRLTSRCTKKAWKNKKGELFCGGCQDEMRLLIRLEEKVRELEQEIQKGMEGIRMKMRRTRQVNQMMGGEGQKKKGRKELPPTGTEEVTSRSSEENRGDLEETLKGLAPVMVVVLSRDDKVTAEQFVNEHVPDKEKQRQADNENTNAFDNHWMLADDLEEPESYNDSNQLDTLKNVELDAVQPTTKRSTKRRKRKAALAPTFNYFDDDDDNDSTVDSDYSPKRKSKSPSNPKVKAPPKKKDEDWTLHPSDISDNDDHPRVRQCNYTTITCPICEKPLTKTGDVLKNHLWTHKSYSEKSLALSTSPSTVPWKIRCKNHQCDQCGKTFNKAYSLANHKLTKHPSPDNPPNSSHGSSQNRELCPECGRTYKSVKHHYQTVHQSRFTCMEPNCGQTFPQLSRLTRHKDAVHRKIRPYQCSHCPRSFAKKIRLELHVNLHLGIRPWQCSGCECKFAQKAHLKRHEKIYHSEGSNPKRKPFVRGATQLGCDVKKEDLQKGGKYLPPSALASWAQGRQPTSHFPKDFPKTNERGKQEEEME